MAATLQEVSDKASIFPGNALGSTWLPDFLNPSAITKVGEGSTQSHWSEWLSDVNNAAVKILNPLASYMPTAKDIVTHAGEESVSFVKRMEAKALGAVTGVGESVAELGGGIRDTVKYAAWGLGALAVIYVIAVLVVPVSASLGKK